MKNLMKLLQNIAFESKGNLPDEIENISNNSNQITNNSLFVSIVGENVDGHEFVELAIENGAIVVVVERFLNMSIPQIKVSNTKIALAQLSANYYDNPSTKLKIIGITGTNGKTTVVYLLRKIFKKAGLKCGSIGTLGYVIDCEKFPTNLTTPDSLQLQQIFAEMVEKGVTHVTMEVSSHSIALNRIENINFVGVAFTNLSQDHLDYHKTIEHYAATKAILFEKTDGFKICNIDDKYSPYFLKNGSILTTSINKNSDYKWNNDVAYKSGITGTILSPFGKIKVQTKLSGVFNLYNILTAVACAFEVGVDIESIEKTLQNIMHIPGRLQEINTINKSRIFIDYAHTPDAIENVLLTLRDILPENGKLISLFGCGGNRDKTKRPKMAKATEKYSDFCILTSDNSRFEDPIQILKDTFEGFSGNVPYITILDRKEAIEFGLSLLSENIIFAILGKGHENYIDVMGVKHPFDEQQIIQDYYEKHK